MNDLREYVEKIKNELVNVYEGNAQTNDGEIAGFYDYFEDALDWNYTIDSQGRYRGVRVYVTLGGPNIWIDTINGEVAGAWGCDCESVWLPSEICEEIDSVFEDYYQCIA